MSATQIRRAFTVPFASFSKLADLTRPRRLIRRPSRKTERRPLPISLETLEQRLVLDATLSLATPAFESIGPIDIDDNGSEGAAILTDGSQERATIGAISSIAVHPNQTTVYVGTVNGGVWKTTDINRVGADGSPAPDWEPLTDDLPSLSMSTVALSKRDPTDVYAGVGHVSNGFHNGALTGLYRSTNSGKAGSWRSLGSSSFSGKNISDIDSALFTEDGRTKENIFVSTLHDTNGLYRISPADRIELISGKGGLPAGPVHDVLVLGNPRVAGGSIIFAAVVQPYKKGVNIPGTGVYASEDNGQTWLRITESEDLPRNNQPNMELQQTVGNTDFVTSLLLAGAGTRLVMSVVTAQSFGSDLQYTFRRDLTQPLTSTWETAVSIGSRDYTPILTTFIAPGGQALFNSSLVVHPTQTDTFFVAGDRQQPIPSGSNGLSTNGTNGPVARVFRKIGNAVSTQVIFNGASQTAPHPDTRAMAFAGNDLLQADDGGLYKLQNPLSATPNWVSVNGDLVITEVANVAYDPLRDETIVGAQDNGSIYALNSDGTDWSTAVGGDGNHQAVGIELENGNPVSYRYSMANNFRFFERLKYDGSGFISNSDIALASSPGAAALSGLVRTDQQFTAFDDIPLALNRSNPSRMVLGYNGVYESFDRGDTIRRIAPPTGTKYGSGLVSAVAYGTTSNANALYVARRDKIYVREGSGSQFDRVVQLPGATKAHPITGLAIDPSNASVAYANDDRHVWATTDFGRTWTEITGSLSLSRANRGVKTLEFAKLPASGSLPAVDVLLIGGQTGVYRALNPVGTPGAGLLANKTLVWTRFGAPGGSGTALPNAIVADLHYHAPNFVNGASKLLVGTYGRGVWTIDSVDAELRKEPVLKIQGDNAVNQVELVAVSGSRKVQVKVNGSVQRTYDLDQIGSIVVTGPQTELTVDTRISVPGGISFGGPGAGKKLNLKLHVSPQAVQLVTQGATAGEITIPSEFGPFKLSYDTLSNPVQTVLPTNVANALFRQFGINLPNAAGPQGSTQKANSKTKIVALDGLLAAVERNQSERPQPVGVAPGTVGPRKLPQEFTDDPLDLIESVLLSGPDDFRFEDIGDSIATPEDLRDILDRVDNIPGNVTLTKNGDFFQFDINVRKTLDGESNFNFDLFNEAFTIDGAVDVSADVSLHLIAGVDANGFYVDTKTQRDPQLSLSNVTIAGDIQAGGLFGLVGVKLSDAKLQTGKGFSIGLGLEAPAKNSYGETNGKLRGLDLVVPDFDLLKLNVVKSPTQPDVSLQANLLAGLGSVPLLNKSINIAWNDATKLDSFSITGVDEIKQLNTKLKSAIKTGLDKLVEVGRSLGNSGALTQKIGFLNGSVGDLVDVANILDDRFRQPILAYLDGLQADEFPTVGGIEEIIQKQLAQIGDLDLSLSGIDLGFTNNELTINFPLHADRTVKLPLDFDFGGAPLGFKGDLNSDVVFSFNANIGLGVDLSKIDTPADATFVKFDQAPKIEAKLNVGNAQVAANIGFLGATAKLGSTEANNPTILDASVTANFHDPNNDGKFTLTEIANTSFSNLVTITADGKLGAAIQVQATLAGQPFPTANHKAQIAIVDEHLFDSTAPDVITTGFEDLFSFDNVNASDILSSLKALLTYFDSLASGGLLDVQLPFTSKRIRDVVDLAKAFSDGLIKRLEMPNQPGTPSFGSSEDLASIAPEFAGIQFVTDLDGNPATKDPGLTYDFSFEKHFDILSTPINLGFDLGPLGGVSTNSAINIDADVDVGFKFGIALTKVGANYRLTPETKISSLNGGQGVQFKPNGTTEVRVTLHDGTTFDVPFNNATTIAQVIAAINAASPGAAKFVAAINDAQNGLKLTDKTTGTTEFTVKMLNKSLAGFGLGILGSGDRGGNGQLKGTTLKALLTNNTKLADVRRGQGLTLLTGNTPQLRVKLHDGRSFDVAFNNPKTVGDLITQIKAAAPSGAFDVKFNKAHDGLDFIDNTSGFKQFEVSALNGSQVGTQLGLIGHDDNGRGIKDGLPLHGLTFLDNVFLVNPHIDAGIQLSSPDIDAAAKFGFLKLGIENGSASVSAQVKMNLSDPGITGFDGRTTISELVRALPKAQLSIQGEKVAPTTGVVQNGTEFQLKLGKDSYVLRLSGTGDNTNRDQLVDDLNLALKTAKGPAPTTNTTDLSARVHFCLKGDKLAVTLSDGSGEMVEIIDADELGFTGAGQSAYLLKPLIKADINVNLPIVTDALLAAVIAPGQAITVTSPTGGLIFDPVCFVNPFKDIVVGLPMLQDLSKYKDLNFDAILKALESVLRLLETIEAQPWASNQLPGINASLSDLLEFTTKFREFVQKLRENPQSTVQDVEKAIEEALSLPPELLTFSLDATKSPRHTDQTKGAALRIDLNFNPSVTKSMPLGFDLSSLGVPGLNDIIDVEAAANIELQAGVNFQASFGVDITQVTDIAPFFYDYVPATGKGTKFEITAKALANHINFAADIGPLGVFVHEGSAGLTRNAMNSTDPARFAIELKTPSGGTGRHYFSQGIGKIYDDTDTVLDAKVFAHLPVAFPTADQHVVDIDFNFVPSLDNPPGAFTFNTDEIKNAFKNKLDFSPEKLGSMLRGWKTVLNLVIDAFKGKVLGFKLPMVGDALKDQARFLEDLRDRVFDNFDSAKPSLKPVQQAIFDALGPGGLNLLVDENKDGEITRRDVIVALGDDGVEFNLHLARDLFNVTQEIPFDVGVPGLSLAVEGGVQLQLGFDARFAFGVTSKDGFYLDTSTPELFKVFFHAGIPGLKARGQLGILQLDVADDKDAPSKFDGTASITLVDPSGDKHLTLGEIRKYGLSKTIIPSLSAVADVNLDIVASFLGSKDFPRLRTDFEFDWSFSKNDPKVGNTAPTVAFNNIGLNLGDFISNFAGPVFNQIKDIVEPIKPVLDLLTTPLPVLSQLAGEDITMLDLASLFGLAKAADYIEAIDDVIDIVTSIPDIGPDTWIVIGSFDVDGFQAVNSKMAGKVKPRNVNPMSLDKIREQIGQASPQAMTFEQKINNIGKASISFPIKDNPLSLFSLLVGGGPVDLVKVQLPTLEVGFKYVQTFPLPAFPILSVLIGGGLSAKIDFDFGYDTQGLQDFFRTKQPVDLINGFFVPADINKATGRADPQVTLAGSVIAGAALDLQVIRLGATGGITAKIEFALNDPNLDGKVRLDEIGDNFLAGGPLNIFDTTAVFEGFLSAFFEVTGVFKREFEIVRAELFSIKAPHIDPPPPSLATLEGSVLRVNVGARAGNRTKVNKQDGDETIMLVPGEDGGASVVTLK